MHCFGTHYLHDYYWVPVSENKKPLPIHISFITILKLGPWDHGYGPLKLVYFWHLNPELGCRPKDEGGEKVMPSMLPTFRADGFCWPCCLCSVPGLDGVGIGYKESAVCMSIDGEHFGEYVVRCTDRECRYKGECYYSKWNEPVVLSAVYIEWSYAMPGLPTKPFRCTQSRSWCLNHCRSSTNSL